MKKINISQNEIKTALARFISDSTNTTWANNSESRKMFEDIKDALGREFEYKTMKIGSVNVMCVYLNDSLFLVEMVAMNKKGKAVNVELTVQQLYRKYIKKYDKKDSINESVGDEFIMTNKELAAQCLIEAAELLGESAGRNGAFDREYATKKLNEIKRIPDEEYRNKMLKDDLFDLEKEARTGKTYDNYNKSPLYKGKEYFDEMDDRRRRRKFADPDYVHRYDREYQRKKKFNQKINHNAELAEARKKLAAAKDEFDRRKRENDELRKAAKNESVDIDALLEEAMDLLDY